MEKDPDFQSPKKRRKLDLPAKSCFANAVSDEKMAVMLKGYVPPNTQNGRFPCVPLVACIPVFFNSHLQAPLCFPDIHLTTLAGDLVDHTYQFLLGEGVLHLGE